MNEKNIEKEYYEEHHLPFQINEIYSEQKLREIHENLNNIIDSFVEKYAHGPVQGSALWIKRRHKTIGGSEISTLVLAKDPWAGKNTANLILSKIGAKKFTGSVHTRWGNLFEPLITEYFEYMYNTKVKGDQIFVYGIHPNQSYSPDGIAVIDNEVIAKVFSDNFNEEIYNDGNVVTSHTLHYYPIKITIPTITLVEFKSPWSRIPNGSIPKNYECQVLAGLDTIKICHTGLYCEGVFRSCSVDQWDDNNLFNTRIHNRDGKIWKDRYPIAAGFILFTCERVLDPEDINLERQIVMNKPGEIVLDEIKDYGNVELGELENLFYYWHKDKLLDVYYSPIITVDEGHQGDHNISELEDKVNELSKKIPENHAIYGILPWKLMRVDTIKVEKQNNYISKYQDRINKVINIVNKCNQYKTISERMVVYNREYLGYKNDSTYDDGYDD